MAPRQTATPGLRHVFLRDMVLTASVGVHAFEHAASQRIRINLDLDVTDQMGVGQGQAAIGPDELSRVVDYESVAKRVRAIVAAGHVRLLETLAERLAAACLEDHRVRAVWVRIEKLDIFNDMASVGVEILRQAASI
jgi:dihydroneopterin aldolase